MANRTFFLAATLCRLMNIGVSPEMFVVRPLFSPMPSNPCADVYCALRPAVHLGPLVPARLDLTPPGARTGAALVHIRKYKFDTLPLSSRPRICSEALITWRCEKWSILPTRHIEIRHGVSRTPQECLERDSGAAGVVASENIGLEEPMCPFFWTVEFQTGVKLLTTDVQIHRLLSPPSSRQTGPGGFEHCTPFSTGCRLQPGVIMNISNFMAAVTARRPVVTSVISTADSVLIPTEMEGVMTLETLMLTDLDLPYRLPSQSKDLRTFAVSDTEIWQCEILGYIDPATPVSVLTGTFWSVRLWSEPVLRIQDWSAQEISLLARNRLPPQSVKTSVHTDQPADREIICPCNQASLHQELAGSVIETAVIRFIHAQFNLSSSRPRFKMVSSPIHLGMLNTSPQCRSLNDKSWELCLDTSAILICPVPRSLRNRGPRAGGTYSSGSLHIQGRFEHRAHECGGHCQLIRLSVELGVSVTAGAVLHSNSFPLDLKSDCTWVQPWGRFFRKETRVLIPRFSSSKCEHTVSSPVPSDQEITLLCSACLVGTLLVLTLVAMRAHALGSTLQGPRLPLSIGSQVKPKTRNRWTQVPTFKPVPGVLAKAVADTLF
nr:MAG: hypothetical protein [Rhabdoviridae sp.]